MKTVGEGGGWSRVLRWQRGTYVSKQKKLKILNRTVLIKRQTDTRICVP